jgi:hypothetical protein
MVLIALFLDPIVCESIHPRPSWIIIIGLCTRTCTHSMFLLMMLFIYLDWAVGGLAELLLLLHHLCVATKHFGLQALHPIVFWALVTTTVIQTYDFITDCGQKSLGTIPQRGRTHTHYYPSLLLESFWLFLSPYIILSTRDISYTWILNVWLD